MMPWMPVKLFWLMPLMCFVMFLVRTLMSKRDRPDFGRMSAFPKNDSHPASAKTYSSPIPEALKQAGQQVLDGLDWEIRLLERQQTIVSDPKERRTIEKELHQKRAEYQAAAERLHS